jgi:hypothetical protein
MLVLLVMSTNLNSGCYCRATHKIEFLSEALRGLRGFEGVYHRRRAYQKSTETKVERH